MKTLFLIMLSGLVLGEASEKSGGLNLRQVNEIPGRGDITDIAGLTPSNIVITTQAAGLHHTTDGGIIFRGINPPGSPILDRNYTSVYIDGVGNIYAGGGANYFGNSPGFQVSTDVGVSWNTVGLPNQYISDITGSQEVCVASRTSGVYKYTNNILTPLNTGLPTGNLNSLFIDATDQDPFFAGRDNGLYSLDQPSQTWGLTSLNIPIRDIVKGENNTTYVASDNIIFQTTDNANFSAIPDLNPGGNFRFTSMEYSAPYLYATLYPLNRENTFPLVHRYNIGAQNWEPHTVGLSGNYGIPQVMKIVGNKKFLGTTIGFYSGDVSGPWESPTQVLKGGQTTSVSYNPTNGYYYVGGNLGGLYVSNDIDQRFTKNDTNLKLSDWVRDVEHTPSGTLVIQSTAVNFQLNVLDPFERRQAGIGNYSYTSADYNPNNQTTVLGTSNGIFYSTNVGITWQPTNRFNYVVDVVHSETNNNFYASEIDGLIVGDGNGQTFTRLVNNIFSTAFALNDDPLDWEIGLATFNTFLEVDDNGTITPIGYAGLPTNEYIQRVVWSDFLRTWLGATETGVYSLDQANNNWVLEDEVDDYILFLGKVQRLTEVQSSFHTLSNPQGGEQFFVGTFGGGLYTSAAPTSVESTDNDIVADYSLAQNYPNPFNPSTTIKYSTPAVSLVTIRVYDILGKEVATLLNETREAGTYEVEFNANRLSSGVYFYRLHAGDFVGTRKMVLVR